VAIPLRRTAAYARSVNAPAADRLTRFSDRAGDYARHRPSYPTAALDALLQDLPTTARFAADIGAGTGISSRLLADRGFEVIAIEPNAAMRASAEPHPRITWHDATGESTGLPDHSLNLVLCAQAFHWLNPHAALAEFRRILKPGGRIALIWNIHDESWPASRTFKSIMVTNATEPPTSPWFLAVGEPLTRDPALVNARIVRVSNEQTHDLEGLIGRATSASYAPKEGPSHDAMIRQLTALFDQHQHSGRITLRYVTEVHLAETPR